MLHVYVSIDIEMLMCNILLLVLFLFFSCSSLCSSSLVAFSKDSLSIHFTRGSKNIECQFPCYSCAVVIFNINIIASVCMGCGSLCMSWYEDCFQQFLQLHEKVEDFLKMMLASRQHHVESAR